MFFWDKNKILMNGNKNAKDVLIIIFKDKIYSINLSNNSLFN